MNDQLFSFSDTHMFANAQREGIYQEIQAGHLDDLIREDPEKAIKHMLEEYTLELVEIDYEKKEPKSVIRGDMLEVSFYITFTGNPLILKYHPSSFSSEFVLGIVDDDKIRIKLTGRLGVDKLAHEVKQWQDDLKSHLNSANEDAGRFNNSLQGTIESKVNKRAKQLRIADDEIAAMGFPTKKP